MGMEEFVKWQIDYHSMHERPRSILRFLALSFLIAIDILQQFLHWLFWKNIACKAIADHWYEKPTSDRNIFNPIHGITA